MDIVVTYLIRFYVNNSINLHLLTPQFTKLNPHYGDRIVTIESVTSPLLRPMCILAVFVVCLLRQIHQMFGFAKFVHNMQTNQSISRSISLINSLTQSVLST